MGVARTSVLVGVGVFFLCFTYVTATSFVVDYAWTPPYIDCTSWVIDEFGNTVDTRMWDQDTPPGGLTLPLTPVGWGAAVSISSSLPLCRPYVHDAGNSIGYSNGAYCVPNLFRGGLLQKKATNCDTNGNLRDDGGCTNVNFNQSMGSYECCWTTPAYYLNYQYQYCGLHLDTEYTLSSTTIDWNLYDSQLGYVWLEPVFVDPPCFNDTYASLRPTWTQSSGKNSRSFSLDSQFASTSSMAYRSAANPSVMDFVKYLQPDMHYRFCNYPMNRIYGETVLASAPVLQVCPCASCSSQCTSQSTQSFRNMDGSLLFTSAGQYYYRYFNNVR